MIGSMIASQIEAEMRREKYWKEKKRVKCAIDEKKQCTICKFQKICEDAEEQNTIK